MSKDRGTAGFEVAEQQPRNFGFEFSRVIGNLKKSRMVKSELILERSLYRGLSGFKHGNKLKVGFIKQEILEIEIKSIQLNIVLG